LEWFAREGIKILTSLKAIVSYRVSPNPIALFVLSALPIALASPDTGQHPSATPPVGGAFPKEIDPSTPHSGLPGTSANLVDRPDKLKWCKHGSTV